MDFRASIPGVDGDETVWLFLHGKTTLQVALKLHFLLLKLWFVPDSVSQIPYNCKQFLVINLISCDNDFPTAKVNAC